MHVLGMFINYDLTDFDPKKSLQGLNLYLYLLNTTSEYTLLKYDLSGLSHVKG